MTNKIDYKKLGFKCGLEIHQQLATKNKLFCDCSAALEDKEPVFEIKRKLRPVAGETGEIDTAAIYETLKDKTFTYKVFKNESCQVELDEEPPHPMNAEALDIGLQVALMMNCEIPEEIQVMRKTVLDGSNTSGFQRTAIVGINGWIDTGFGKVGITNVSVEEDACMIIDKKTKDGTEFGLNRLGVPLVEIGTTPNIPDPEQAKEVSSMIGMILRSTGKVKRGIGTIRQDLNVSIRKGARVEIKGVQDLKLIPKLAETEIDRQLELIKKGKKVTMDVRKALTDGTTKFLRPLPGAARMYPETDIPPIEVLSSKLDSMRKSLPKLISDKSKELEALGLDNNLASTIAKDAKLLAQFKDFLKLKNLKPSYLANTLLSYKKEILANHPKLKPEKIKEKDLREVLEALNSGKISKANLLELLSDVANGKKLEIKTSDFSVDDVRKIVQGVIKKNPQVLSMGRPEQALMGLVMKEIRGRAPGDIVMTVLAEEIKKN